MDLLCSCKVSEFKDQLLFSAGVSPERILEFSCGEYRSTGDNEN